MNLRPFFVGSLAIAAMAWTPLAVITASEVDANFHLYLLMGQSNMAGRGTVDAESLVTDPRVQMLDKEGHWVPAKDPLHFDKPEAGVGPGLTFGKRMAAANPQVRIGLIPCAVGGTSITRWVPGGFDKATKTHPYDDMVARARIAQQHGVLKGVIWHQGESDRGHSTTYAQDLTDLIARVRSDLSAPDIPFVAGELAAFTPRQEAPVQEFNVTLHTLEGTISHFAIVTSTGCQHRGDSLHFDTASARMMGERFATQMLALHSKAP